MHKVFPPYIVMSDKVLQNLCEARPQTVEAFGTVSGIGEFKKEKYGKDFVESDSPFQVIPVLFDRLA